MLHTHVWDHLRWLGCVRSAGVGGVSTNGMMEEKWWETGPSPMARLHYAGRRVFGYSQTLQTVVGVGLSAVWPLCRGQRRLPTTAAPLLYGCCPEATTSQLERETRAAVCSCMLRACVT
jgi:hypothetical protein